MEAVLIFLVAIFGQNVQGTKIRAIRTRTIQYLPTKVPEVPVQTEYNWKQWQSPINKNDRLIYNYEGPNGIRYNMFGGGGAYANGNRNYMNGGIYQSVAQSGSATGGMSLGQTLQGIQAVDNTNGQLGYSTIGENGVRIVPSSGQSWQNVANLGQISLSSDISGAHSAASAYSAAQNIGRSKLNMVDSGIIGDNADKIVAIDENVENKGSNDNDIDSVKANDDENSNVSLVNEDKLDYENKEGDNTVDQSVLNEINNAPVENMINEIGLNNEDNGLIDSVSGDEAYSPDDGAKYLIDQNKPSFTNDAPLKSTTEDYNFNNNIPNGFDNYPLDSNLPSTRPHVHRKANLWRFYKLYFNNLMRKILKRNENRKLVNNNPINVYPQPSRKYYDAWLEYIRNRQSPTPFDYETYPGYFDGPEKPTAESVYAINRDRDTSSICQNKHINVLPEKEKVYYDAGNIDGNQIVNKEDYIINIMKRLNIKKVPKSIFENLKFLNDVDYANGVNPEGISIESTDQVVPNSANPNIKQSIPNEYISQVIYKPTPNGPSYSNLIPIPKVRPLISNDDTLPFYDSKYSNLIPEEYKNIFNPKVRPLRSNEDTPGEMYTPTPYDATRLNPILNQYNNIPIPKVIPPVSNEDTLPEIYVPPFYDSTYSNSILNEYKHIPISKVRLLVPNADTLPDIYSSPSYHSAYSHPIPKAYKIYPQPNDDGSDFESSVFPFKPNSDINIKPVNPVENTNQDFIQGFSDFSQNYLFKPTVGISEDMVDSSETDTKNILEIPNSQITNRNFNGVDKNIPSILDKDALKIYGTPWGWNWNKVTRDKMSLNTQEQYIRQNIEALITQLLSLYNNKCSRRHVAELLNRFNAEIALVKSKNCDISAD